MTSCAPWCFRVLPHKVAKRMSSRWLFYFRKQHASCINIHGWQVCWDKTTWHQTWIEAFTCCLSHQDFFFLFYLENRKSTPPLLYYFFFLTLLSTLLKKNFFGDTVTVTRKSSRDLCSAVSPVDLNFTTKQQDVTHQLCVSENVMLCKVWPRMHCCDRKITWVTLM